MQYRGAAGDDAGGRIQGRHGRRSRGRGALELALVAGAGPARAPARLRNRRGRRAAGGGGVGAAFVDGAGEALQTQAPGEKDLT